jgi:NaMN:DMB phosphoribosyltransferase
MSVEWVNAEVAAINVAAAAAAEERQGQLTKPPGSLGRLRGGETVPAAPPYISICR